MNKSKILAFDVYGTILMTNDPENCVPAREGFIEFAEYCLKKGKILVTSSDNGTGLVKIDLSESGVALGIFSNHFRMTKGKAKDFTPIIAHYGISPEELLVFGDRLDFDIAPALAQGCRAIPIPPFENLHDNFDWMSIIDTID